MDIESIKDEIIVGNTEIGIEQLLQGCKKTYHEKSSQLISSEYQETIRIFVSGLITNDEKQVRINRINYRILLVLDDLEKIEIKNLPETKLDENKNLFLNEIYKARYLTSELKEINNWGYTSPMQRSQFLKRLSIESKININYICVQKDGPQLKSYRFNGYRKNNS